MLDGLAVISIDFGAEWLKVALVKVVECRGQLCIILVFLGLFVFV